MPAAVAVPLITAAATAGATIAGAKLSSSANKHAADVSAAANKSAVDLATQQEAERRREFDVQQAEAKRQWDAQEANRAPYRDASRAALLKLSDLFGLPISAAGGRSVASGDPTGAIPQRPNDLAAALAQANQIAYGGQNKHADPSYWAVDWAKDPDYTWKRMLGWQAGGADVATSGPFAGLAAAPKAPMTPLAQMAPTIAANPRTVPFSALLRMPYQPRSPMSV